MNLRTAILQPFVMLCGLMVCVCSMAQSVGLHFVPEAHCHWQEMAYEVCLKELEAQALQSDNPRDVEPSRSSLGLIPGPLAQRQGDRLCLSHAQHATCYDDRHEGADDGHVSYLYLGMTPVPDGKTIVILMRAWEYSAYIFIDPENGRELFRAEYKPQMVYSPDFRYLAVMSWDPYEEFRDDEAGLDPGNQVRLVILQVSGDSGQAAASQTPGGAPVWPIAFEQWFRVGSTRTSPGFELRWLSNVTLSIDVKKPQSLQMLVSEQYQGGPWLLTLPQSR